MTPKLSLSSSRGRRRRKKTRGRGRRRGNRRGKEGRKDVLVMRKKEIVFFLDRKKVKREKKKMWRRWKKVSVTNLGT